MPHRFFDALRAHDWAQFDALRMEMPHVNLSELRSQGQTLLHAAAQRDMVRELLARMGSVDRDFLSVKDGEGLQALHSAAVRGTGVEDLLVAGAHVHALDDHACSALFFAAQNGHSNAVGALLAAGASDRGNCEGESAASRALEGGHSDVLRALVEHGVRIPLSPDDWSPERDAMEVRAYGEDAARAIVLVALADLSRPGIARPPSLVADLQSVADEAAFSPGASTLTEEQREARIWAVIDVYRREDHDLDNRPSRAVDAAQRAAAALEAERGIGTHYQSLLAAPAASNSATRATRSPTAAGAGLG